MLSLETGHCMLGGEVKQLIVTPCLMDFAFQRPMVAL